MIDQVRGAVAHASRVARGANAPKFAGKSDQDFVAAFSAPGPREAVSQYAAFHVVTEFVLDVAGQLSIVFLLNEGQKRFEVRGDDLVEGRLLGAVALVAGMLLGHPAASAMSMPITNSG
jgi:hypothetical protein